MSTKLKTGHKHGKKINGGKESSETAHENTSVFVGVNNGSALPEGWIWATIPDLVGANGVFIDGDWVESKDQDPNGDVRLIQLADVGDGVYRDKSNRFMTKARANELRCTFLKNGDVLIARMPDPLGRACIFPGDDKPSVTVVDVAIVRAGNATFDHRWLACFVNAHPFRSAISGLQAGSTRKRISRGNLATIPLPVPPLTEQRRIVAEIEKQFTRLDAGVAALKRVQANLKRYRASVLKAACEGHLVPTEAELAKTGDRKAKFETGEALLARILTERRKNWQGSGKYKEPVEPDITKLGLLPEGWTWASLDQLLSLLRNGISAKPDAESGLPILRISAVRALSVNLAETRYLSAEASDYPDYALAKGDLLFTRYNGNPDLVGVCGVVPLLTSPLVHPDKLIRCKLVPSGALSDFIAIMANVGASRDYLAKRVRTTAGQAGISGGDLKGLPVPLAPLAEQTRIVAEVERRLSVAVNLEAVVAANLRRASRLRQSILQKAFTGDLV